MGGPTVTPGDRLVCNRACYRMGLESGTEPFETCTAFCEGDTPLGTGMRRAAAGSCYAVARAIVRGVLVGKETYDEKFRTLQQARAQYLASPCRWKYGSRDVANVFVEGMNSATRSASRSAHVEADELSAWPVVGEMGIAGLAIAVSGPVLAIGALVGGITAGGLLSYLDGKHEELDAYEQEVLNSTQ